jgi:hypothetical protein
LQKLASSAVVAVVETVAAQQAQTPTFATTNVQDVPPFVPKTVQQQLNAASRKLLQAYVQRHAHPLTTLVSSAFSDPAFVSLATDAVAAPRPFCGGVAERLAGITVEAACLLPAGESLPPGLVRLKLLCRACEARPENVYCWAHASHLCVSLHCSI